MHGERDRIHDWTDRALDDHRSGDAVVFRNLDDERITVRREQNDAVAGWLVFRGPHPVATLVHVSGTWTARPVRGDGTSLGATWKAAVDPFVRPV